MKQFIGWMLALALMLSCGALAEAGEKAISFRDLEWGASYAELSQQNLLGELKGTSHNGVAYVLYNGEDVVNDEGVCCYADYTPEAVKAIGKVAGVELYSVRLYFVYTAGDDGTIIQDEAHTALYGARYNLFVANKKAVADTLAAKLSALYGDVDMTTDFASVWYGADNTFVSVLTATGIHTNGGEVIAVCYATGEGDQMIESAFLGNVDGL